MTADNLAILYDKVRLLKLRQGLHPDTYGIDVISVVRSLRVPVELVDFSSKDVRCVAIPASVGEHDIILLNNRRSAEEKNFDCAHAMMHLALHSSLKRGNFVCVEGIEETEWDREADEAVGNIVFL